MNGENAPSCEQDIHMKIRQGNGIYQRYKHLYSDKSI